MDFTELKNFIEDMTAEVSNLDVGRRIVREDNGAIKNRKQGSGNSTNKSAAE